MQPTAVAIAVACMVWEAFGASLANNSKGDIAHPSTGVFI
jgi:hypothetical protein